VSTVDPDAFDAFEAAGWARQAATYGDFAGTVTSQLADPLLDAAGVHSGTRVVDVATGPGYVAGRAADRGARVIGVDVTEQMLLVARSRHRAVDFRQGDAQQLPLDDDAFDAAVCNFGLLHFGRPERAAAELARVLAPGGRAALTTWDEPSRSRWLGVMLDAIAAVGAAPPPDVPVGPPMFRFADDAEFTRLLVGAGLLDVRVDTIGFALPLGDADELWDGLLGGTVRTVPVVDAQSDEVKAQIRERFDGLLEPYRAGDGYEVPVSVKLASGRKDES
jgi:SAM-dependent methyltransferase